MTKADKEISILTIVYNLQVYFMFQRHFLFSEGNIRDSP